LPQRSVPPITAVMKAFASRTASTSDSPRARPGANGLVELSPFEFLDRLADLVPPPRKHRHRYHGVFAPNHRLRKAVTLPPPAGRPPAGLSADMPWKAAATLMQSPARTTPRGSPGRN
jgi:hypothetical protein